MGGEQNEVYSKVVRAGTYFFDIKATKGNDLYITLTLISQAYTKRTLKNLMTS